MHIQDDRVAPIESAVQQTGDNVKVSSAGAASSRSNRDPSDFCTLLRPM